ncbi:MAG: GNAT family N-acetyltransferase [Pseudomonadota bacterium]
MISLRIITSETADLLARIAPGVFDHPLKPEHLSEFLADPAQHLTVAMDGALVVGQLKAVLHRHPDKSPSLYVEELGVSPTHQRRGIAKDLFLHAKSYAATLGAREIWLATEPDNTAANALYKSLDLSPEHVVVYSAGL